MWDTINQIEKTGISGARAINSFASYANIIRELIEKLNDLDLKSLIEKVINLSTLNQYYELKKNEESLSKQENLEELLSTAERFYQNNMDSENILGDFLDNASLEAGDLQSNPHDDPVQLMTIHSAKGLEFPVVFLTGMDEGIFPNENRNLKKGSISFLIKALPLTVITAFGFLIAVFLLNEYYLLDSAILKVVFIGLASLTFPHILLEYLLEKNEK